MKNQRRKALAFSNLGWAPNSATGDRFRRNSVTGYRYSIASDRVSSGPVANDQISSQGPEVSPPASGWSLRRPQVISPLI